MILYTPDFDYREYMHPAIARDFKGFRGLWHEAEVCYNLVWYHRWCYYVIGEAEITDGAYDRLERRFRTVVHRIKNYPIRYMKLLRTVGSSLPDAYPYNIRRYFELRERLQ